MDNIFNTNNKNISVKKFYVKKFIFSHYPILDGARGRSTKKR